jgi:kynurenine formamidase
VFLNFGWEKYWSSDKDWIYYATNARGFDESAAKYFYNKKIKAIASDTIACDQAIKNGVPIKSFGHDVYWLPNKILIMEGLINLDDLPYYSYFIALPLKIIRGSGSPIRPIALTPKL